MRLFSPSNSPALSAGLLALPLVGITACKGSNSIEMIATPVIYHHKDVAPFAHLPSHKKTVTHEVLSATNRRPSNSWGGLPHGNAASPEVSLGTALVQMGEVDSERVKRACAPIYRRRW